jgi:Sec-independent protein translocase protein TatA
MFIDSYINSGVGVSLLSIQIIVFLFVVIFGYMTILLGIGRPAKDWEKEWKKRHEEIWESKMEEFRRKKHGTGKKEGKNSVEWGKVENEFKLVFYNIGRSINKLFEGKDGKKKRKR